MVKGLSRRVVVVRFPETRAFEQAIFVLRDEKSAGVSSDELVSEACSVAEGYVRRPGRRKVQHPAVYLAAGAAATGIVWLATFLIKLFI